MTAHPTDIPYDAPRSPAVLLFGDDAGRRHHLAGAITISGGRVVASEPMLGATESLDAPPGAGIVLDLREDGGPWLDGLLARLNARAAMAGRPSALILTPIDLLDIVAAQVADPGTAVLVDPEPEELDAALAELVAPLPRTVSDPNGEKGSRQLAQLSEEVERIARTLAELSMDEETAQIDPTALSVASVDGQLVRALLRLRRLRAQYFQPALFADPAWDILLDLAAARIERRRVAVSSLCIAAAVPATTALRWITQMTEQHLLVRQPDSRDGRRVFIGLSEQAALAMDNYLATARRIVAPVG